MHYKSLSYVIVGIIILNSVHTTDTQLAGNCDKLLQNFAGMTATFTYCAISNARPITFCEECVSFYLDVLQAYLAIFETTDETGQPCKIKLLNLDRLEIIEVIFKSTSELWKRGSCDYCFETTSNGTLTQEPRNATKEFFRRDEVFRQCITEHENDTAPATVCKTCRPSYMQLNHHYNVIKLIAAEKDNDNVCMDIVDLMNATRTKWSKKLHCILARQTQIPLYVSGAILLATPVIFYTVSMCLASRDNRRNNEASDSQHRIEEVASTSALVPNEELQVD